MTFDFVLGTVTEFIDYAQIIVAVFFVYYVFKFFTFETPKDKTKRETDEEARIRGARDWIGEKWDKAKTNKKEREEKEKADRIERERKNLLNLARGFVIRAKKAADEAKSTLREESYFQAVSARSQIETAEKNIESARKEVLTAQDKAERKHRDKLRELARFLERMNKDIIRDCIYKGYPTDTKKIGKKIKKIKDKLDEFIGRCGVAIELIDEFIEKDTMNTFLKEREIDREKELRSAEEEIRSAEELRSG